MRKKDFVRIVESDLVNGSRGRDILDGFMVKIERVYYFF